MVLRALDRRGLRPLYRLAQGPGNFGAALGVDLGLNGISIFSARLGFIDRAAEPEIVVGPRIGISKNDGGAGGASFMMGMRRAAPATMSDTGSTLRPCAW